LQATRKKPRAPEHGRWAARAMRTLIQCVFCSLLATISTSGVNAQDIKLDLTAPLGTRSNPVRAQMPPGQREYLMRLRCENGQAPKFDRSGSIGRGPYGNILDGYTVECPGSEPKIVVMDMHHRDYREMTPVPGFTVLPELPARVAKGCPPAVPGTPVGEYIFNGLELEWPARMQTDALKLKAVGVKGRVYVRLVVTAAGKADPTSVEVLHIANEELRPHALSVINRMLFQPAEHHPGCKVPQRIEFGLDFP
jgi:hypothetical protein